MNREIMDMPRRIVATVLLQPMLDEEYHQARASTYEWSDMKP
jgi:hypothetical protein